MTPAAVAHPSTTEEVADAIRQAADHGLTVKAVGSGHSFTPIAATDGLLLFLDRLTGIVSADTRTGLVTVRAGTYLHVLTRALWALGLALENQGDIDRQTISGALATGTHGTGARFAGLASGVRGLRIVLADGRIVDCDAEHDPELLEAARIGLGAFGIITELTLQCVPAFLLQAHEQPGTLSGVLDELDELVDRTDHLEFYWFPHTDRVLTKRNTRLPADAEPNPLPRWRAWLDDDLLSNTVFERINRIATARPALIPRINAISGRALSARTFTAPAYEVFASRRDVVFREMEYALPRAALPGVLAELKRITDRSDIRTPFPVEVRFAPADDMWLSTAHGRDSAYVAIHQYHRLDHRAYFEAFESVARSAHGRPHWGKLHGRSRADLEPEYPRMGDALAVRDRVDPERRFANAYLARVLGD